MTELIPVMQVTPWQCRRMVEQYRDIVAFMEGNGPVSRRDVQLETHISSDQAKSRLRRLREVGIVDTVGRSRATRYVLVDADALEDELAVTNLW